MAQSAAPTPVAEFSIRLLVGNDGSVSVRVTPEMFVEGTDPRLVDEALGPAMEELTTQLAQHIGFLKNEHRMREILKR